MIPPFWVMGHHHSSRNFYLFILMIGWKWGENLHNYFEYVVDEYDNYKIPIDGKLILFYNIFSYLGRYWGS